MTYLLDVNLLLVFHHPLHPHFKLVRRWFGQGGEKSFATCPITQSGLLRLLTQGTPESDPYTVLEGRDALQNLIRRPGHVFWEDAPDYLSATKGIFTRVQGHRQTTDAYLLGLAIHNGGKLATLDRGFRHLAGKEFAANVEIIEPGATLRPRIN